MQENDSKLPSFLKLTQESQNLLCYLFSVKRSDSFLYKNNNKRGSTYENIVRIKRDI